MRAARNALTRRIALAVGLLVVPAAASAAWTPVSSVPAVELFSTFANADSIAVGAQSVVYLSTDGGTHWRQSAALPGALPLTAVWIRNGRIYGGTYGGGVYVSDDLGATWIAYNEGLVGGPLDTQLDVIAFQVRGDSMYAGTAGAGIYMRRLTGPATWQHFGDVFEPNQASNVNSLAIGGTRLIAAAGANGMVFSNDPGATDWTISDLDNVGIHAGLGAMTSVWNGNGWVVGTNSGVFLSLEGQEPWTRVNLGLGSLNWITFAARGPHLYGAFSSFVQAVIEESDDDGATWHDAQVFPGVFIHDLAISGNTLFAARGDGLWRSPLQIDSVPADEPPVRVRFAMAGPQPFTDRTRVRFELPRAGRATIEVFDVMGRATGERVDAWWTAGPHEVEVEGRFLSPGIYGALLTAGDAREVLRLIHVR